MQVGRPIYTVKIRRFDYTIRFWTPRGDLCHLFLDELRDVPELERTWERGCFDAYVVRVVDTHDGKILYERAQA